VGEESRGGHPVCGAARCPDRGLLPPQTCGLAGTVEHKASKETDDTPLPRETHLLIDGEVPLEDAAEGRVPQPGPPKPDGSYVPHGLRDGYTPSQPVDLAAWKQQDYVQLPYAQELSLSLSPVIETGARLPTLSIGFGVHGSLGIGGYGDLGDYIVAGDTTGHLQLLQPYAGGGGTTGIFGEVTPVVFISNAPLEKWPGWSVNVGGSIELGFSVGADVVVWKDEQGHHYFGLQITPGIGLGYSPEFALPIEFHGGASHTWKPVWRLKR